MRTIALIKSQAMAGISTGVISATVGAAILQTFAFLTPTALPLKEKGKAERGKATKERIKAKEAKEKAGAGAKEKDIKIFLLDISLMQCTLENGSGNQPSEFGRRIHLLIAPLIQILLNLLLRRMHPRMEIMSGRLMKLNPILLSLLMKLMNLCFAFSLETGSQSPCP